MLLAIDTCGALGGVALGKIADAKSPTAHERRQGQPALCFRELTGKSYAELLLATIAEMLRTANVDAAQLSGIVVVHGPGSFTGIRIGVSAAKGLAEGLAIPVIAISRLELLARQAPSGSAAAMLEAGRGEFFLGLYRSAECEAEVLSTREALALAIADSGLPVLVCEPQVFEALCDLRPELVAAPTAADALRVGAERFRAGAFDDVATLDANYLRHSEVEMLARIAEHGARRSARAAASSPR